MGLTALHHAAGNGEEESVKLLLEQNADPNAETEDGITPLLGAMAAGSLRCVQLLVNAGARANVSVRGATPLHIAAFTGSPEMIKTLLEAGADPDEGDVEGLKPVQVAASMGNRVAVALLFPVTSPIQGVPEWSVDGLIKHMKAQEKARIESNKAKGNRSLCWIHATVQALADAKACREVRPDWFREGAALRLVLKFEDAETSK